MLRRKQENFRKEDTTFQKQNGSWGAEECKWEGTTLGFGQEEGIKGSLVCVVAVGKEDRVEEEKSGTEKNPKNQLQEQILNCSDWTGWQPSK